LLARAADAARQAGRYASAVMAFEQAVDRLTADGDRRAAGQASVLAANVMRHMTDPRAEKMLAAGLALLEQEPPGPELVDAYAEVAGHEYVLGSFVRSIEWADRALGLAQQLGSGPSMRALGFRGASRCLLGDAEGLEDMHAALSLGLERGAGRDTALLYANLAGVSWLNEGPRASWKVYEEGVLFARRRGITEFALITEAASLEALFDLGRWDEVLALFDRLDEPLEASGAALDLLWMRTVKGHVLAERGSFDDAGAIVDAMASSVRGHGDAQLIVPTLTVSAMCHAARQRLSEAGRLVEEMVAIAGVGSDPNCLPYLPTLAALAVACGRPGDAERLAAAIGTSTARHLAVHASVGAIVAEAHDEFEVAGRGYARARELWAALGVVLEEAAAMEGQARSMARAGRGPEAATLHATAGEMFMALGARSRMGEDGGASSS
jgi:tetratricopeptide (TPR) repeat protein